MEEAVGHVRGDRAQPLGGPFQKKLTSFKVYHLKKEPRCLLQMHPRDSRRTIQLLLAATQQQASSSQHGPAGLGVCQVAERSLRRPAVELVDQAFDANEPGVDPITDHQTSIGRARRLQKARIVSKSTLRYCMLSHRWNSEHSSALGRNW